MRFMRRTIGASRRACCRCHGRIVGDSHERPCRSAVALGQFTVSQYGRIFDYHNNF